MDLKKIDLDKLQDYAFTPHELAMSEMASDEKFINIKCLDNENLVSTVQAILIPKGATNGDMIKAVFSNQTISCAIPITDRNGAKFYRTTINGVTDFTEDWWNAPYKAQGE